MKQRAIALFLVVITLGMLIVPVSAFSREYVVTISRNINLRTGPGTDRFIIGRAWKGDIYELVDEAGNWYEILMFSGDYRYISKSWAARLTEDQLLPGHNMSLPADGDRLNSLYLDILHARERAGREADEIIPPLENEDRNRILRNILEDRHILEVMQIYSIQPALYCEIVNEMGGGADCETYYTANR
ncbi:MAG: SH3 domain-containing protein [bacterium]|jgi:hypothetical protein